MRYDVEFGVGGISVWGEAIPNWISAVGGLIATLVALVAFFQGRSNRDGLEEVKSVENARANTGVGQGGVRGSRRVELREDGRPPARRVNWRPVTEKHGRMLLNLSTDTTANVLSFRSSKQGAVNAQVAMPVAIRPLEGLPFHVPFSLPGRSLASIDIEWMEGEAGPFFATYLV